MKKSVSLLLVMGLLAGTIGENVGYCCLVPELFWLQKSIEERYHYYKRMQKEKEAARQQNANQTTSLTDVKNSEAQSLKYI